MSNKTAWVVGAAFVAVVAVGGYYLTAQQKSEVRSVGLSAPLATPPGISLQFLGRLGQGYGENIAFLVVNHPPVAFADARGITLYTYDKDALGRSLCSGECAETLKPALAPPGAKLVASWSVVTRDDGGNQWAVNGKPVYTYIKDKRPGESAGDEAGNPDQPGSAYAPGALARNGLKPVLPPGAHIALFKPDETLTLPHGISAQSISDANGVVLTDSKEMTLYAFDGDINEDRPACTAPPCPSHWTPATAPALANPVGDFTIVSRNDGLRQWVYKGKPLYTFDGDLQTSFANGIGVDKRWHVAAVVNYFIPSNVTIGQTPGRGAVLATAGGQTLYKRDGFAFLGGGGHSIRHGLPNRPAVGRGIGTKGCDAECLKTWHPYLAPTDAQPQGYWDIATRDDGSKQWVYQGFALYTYDGDKKPGDMTGNDIYDIALSDDPNKVIDVGVPMNGAAALYWTIVAP